MGHTNILLDSSAIIALVIQEDTHHQNAQTIFEKNSKASLLITVYEEVLAVLHHRFGYSLARKVGEVLLSNLNISLIHMNKNDLIEIGNIWHTLPPEIDFVDASIIWAQRKSPTPIATFDTHFKKNGYDVVSISN